VTLLEGRFRFRLPPSGVVCILVLTLLLLSCGASRTKAETSVKHESPRAPTPVYDVLELSFQHIASYKNPFFDAAVETEFIAPDSRKVLRKGFYHSGQTWTVRFRPDEAGEWRYQYRFYSRGELLQSGEGGFRATPSGSPGRIRINPANAYRWVFDNGQPYFPLGLQDCVDSHEGRVTTFLVDGEGRNDGTARRLTPDEYFALFGRAGFNLFRFSERNCSYAIHDDLDHYNIANSLATDQLLQSATASGFRVLFGFFGDHAAWDGGSQADLALRRLRGKLRFIDESISDITHTRTVKGEKRFIDYCVARWGVYADFWELLNEREASDEWTRAMAAHVQSVDPEHRPVAISWEKPHLPEIGINTPHWYESEKESDSDRRVQELAVRWKQFGKPVLVGEQGNTGMNWDPRSATRMRVRAWVALFQEIGLIFWNTSWSKFGMNQGRYKPGAVSNIYLGPEERSYTAVLHQFSMRLDSNVRVAPVHVSLPHLARAYGLLSSEVAAVYVHHFANHDVSLRGLHVKIDIPSSPGLQYEWIDPATGSTLARGRVSARQDAILTPPFSTDIALLVARHE
jgi:uncharacterized protein DUF5060